MTSASPVAVLGVPYDGSSSFLRGPALAPARIREALTCGAMNLCAEDGRDLGADRRWRWAGDLTLGSGDEARREIESRAAGILGGGERLLCLGGDHSVSYPLVRAHHRLHGPLDVLHLDAHPDLYDELDGDRFSHACPFARILEEGLVRRLVQVGIRTLNPHQREQAERFGVEVIEMRHGRPRDLSFDGPIYLSLDLDVLDPAFAPGVSHHEPGGLSTRQLLDLLQALRVPILGADLVELNPARDVRGMTAALAAKLVKEILAKMLDPAVPSFEAREATEA